MYTYSPGPLPSSTVDHPIDSQCSNLGLNI